MKKRAAEVPPKCSSCGTREADGSLFINYEPYDRERRREHDDPPRMKRGWSLHLPMCGTCVRSCVKVGVKLDVRSEDRTWGHVDPEGTGG